MSSVERCFVLGVNINHVLDVFLINVANEARLVALGLLHHHHNGSRFTGGLGHP